MTSVFSTFHMTVSTVSVANNATLFKINEQNKKGGMMFTHIPVDLKSVEKAEIDKEILRTAIIAELDAINIYEQMAAMTKDENLKKVLLDVAQEEKTHVGEFQTMLLKKDKEQVDELAHGEKEVRELIE